MLPRSWPLTKPARRRLGWLGSTGSAKPTVLRLLDEAGVQRRRQSLTDEQVGLAIHLYGLGWSLVQVGVKLGCDHGAVMRALDRAGVPPRLKIPIYLERRRFLNYAWDRFKIIYGVLPIKQQTDLHRYFQTEADLSDDELLAKRTALTAADPSLPNRAGKALVQIDGAFRYAYEHSNGDLVRFHRAVQQLTPNRYEHMTTVRRGAAVAERRIKAVPIMNRTIDVKLLAKALLMQLEHEASNKVTDQTDRAA